MQLAPLFPDPHFPATATTWLTDGLRLGVIETVLLRETLAVRVTVGDGDFTAAPETGLGLGWRLGEDE